MQLKYVQIFVYLISQIQILADLGSVVVNPVSSLFLKLLQTTRPPLKLRMPLSLKISTDTVCNFIVNVLKSTYHRERQS